MTRRPRSASAPCQGGLAAQTPDPIRPTLIHRSTVEPLEPRIAPAVLLDARTLVFYDADSDLVIVKFSKDVFPGSATAQIDRANEVFKFDTGAVELGVGGPQQLRLIDLTKFPVQVGVGSIATGLSFSVTAQQRGGDGVADVGAIKGTGISVGQVTIDGDLGQIDAGGATIRIGLAGLSVGSLGARGIDTQIPVPAPTTENPAPDLVSTVIGELTSLRVERDVAGSRVSVLHGRDSNNNLTTLGNLRSISIGGSLRGVAQGAVSSDHTGFIEADGNIGSVRIGTTATDGIHGGGGKSSGRISSGGSIASVLISGTVIGGPGLESGMVSSAGTMGPVTLGNDLQGGAGESSGVIRAFGNLGAVKIGGDLHGGTGAGSGVVFSRGAIRSVLVQGSIDSATAPAGSGAGGITGAAGIGSVRVDGDVLGGAAGRSGFIESDRDVASVSILGNLTGGAGDASGSVIVGGKLLTIGIGGDLLGGAGRQSGFIRSGLDTGGVSIAGLVIGGGGDDSGAISSGGALRTVSLGSALTAEIDTLRGGGGAFSGAVSASGPLGTVKITGGVRGGGGNFSGSLLSFEGTNARGEIAGDIGAVTISGSVTGGSGASSASILADGALKSLTVGALEGGLGAGSASVQTGRGLFGTGDSGAIKILHRFVRIPAGIPGADSATIDIGGNLASLTVGGMATGATIHAGDALGALRFGGDVTDVLVTARGQVVQKTTDLAIASITVKGGVTRSSFLAGSDATGAAVNPDAQIGAVAVTGAWTASNLIAGAAAGTDAGFGNAQDVIAPGTDHPAIFSRIASIRIGGAVTGTSASGDHFGFVAQIISKFQANGVPATLSHTTPGQVVEFATTGTADVTLRELG